MENRAAKKNISLKKLVISLALPLSAGLLGAFFAGDAKSVYGSLRLPLFAPPPWAFGVVWPMLYVLMGAASWRVWASQPGLRPEGRVRSALFDYLTQLLFNLLWSPLFFGLGLRGAALADGLILLFYVLMTARRFWRIDRPAGALMVPYVLWTAFAVLLNLFVVLRN